MAVNRCDILSAELGQKVVLNILNQETDGPPRIGFGVELSTVFNNFDKPVKFRNLKVYFEHNRLKGELELIVPNGADLKLNLRANRIWLQFDKFPTPGFTFVDMSYIDLYELNDIYVDGEVNIVPIKFIHKDFFPVYKIKLTKQQFNWFKVYGIKFNTEIIEFQS